MDFKYRDILLNNAQLGPYPLEKLKRVDRPTSDYVSESKQRSQQDDAMSKIGRGDLGEDLKKKQKIFFNRDPLCSSLSTFQHYIAQFTLPEVAKKKAPLPDNPRILSRHIKSLGYFLGADMIGICRLPKSAVYNTDQEGKEIKCDYKYAIVLLNRKNTTVIRQSYGREWIDDPCSFQTYQRCGCQAITMASYLRRLGWRSDFSIAGKYFTLITPLIIESGLGEGSRLGIALNPFIGASYKASAVLTDLPLEVDKPIDFGLQDYCAGCKICAEQCPMQAISYGDRVEHNGYMTWLMKSEACAVGVLTNTIGNICQRCTKVCPWNRRDNRPEDFADWDGNIATLHQSVNKQAEALRKSNYREPEEFKEKWWFPLVMEGGEIREGNEHSYD